MCNFQGENISQYYLGHEDNSVQKWVIGLVCFSTWARSKLNDVRQRSSAIYNMTST